MRNAILSFLVCLAAVGANAEEIRLSCTNSNEPPSDIIVIDTTARTIIYNGHQTRDTVIANDFFKTIFVVKNGNTYKIQISRMDGSIRIDGNINGGSLSSSGRCTRVTANAF
jgi:hypothetical protein